jgi:hypothetical protein
MTAYERSSTHAVFGLASVVGRALLVAGLMQAGATCALSSQILSVSLNTNALTASSDTFALDFQLIGGGGATSNQIQAASFDFGGGSYNVSSASSTGGATVADGPLIIGLDDTSNFFNEVVLSFVPGNSLRFLLSITNQLSLFPDSFTLAILDNGNEIPTTNPWAPSWRLTSTQEVQPHRPLTPISLQPRSTSPLPSVRPMSPNLRRLSFAPLAQCSWAADF